MLPLLNQVHDFNVHIDSNDVFWMVQVDDDAVEIDFDNGRARLRVRGLGVYDDHDLANSVTQGLGLNGDPTYPYPAIKPVAPVRAKVSFDVKWNNIVASTQIENSAQNFKGTFLSTGATIEWSSEQDGFQFQSEPANPNRNLISVLSCEKNGVFFT
jgi:hypothetical protein